MDDCTRCWPILQRNFLVRIYKKNAPFALKWYWCDTIDTCCAANCEPTNFQLPSCCESFLEYFYIFLFLPRIMSHRRYTLVNLCLISLVLSTFASEGSFEYKIDFRSLCSLNHHSIHFLQTIIRKKIQCMASRGCIFRMETACHKSPI